jgi:hypothetical protein
VVLTRFEEDAVIRPDDLDRATATLRQADAFGDEDGLSVWVRVPGRAGARVKWTLLALSREPRDGAATESTNTAPVNQSLGPAVVAIPFLVTCMALPLL